MAGYFEEMGWEPLRDGETPNNFLQVARFLLEFQYVDPETPLAPAASKEAVAALPEISISEEGKFFYSSPFLIYWNLFCGRCQ